jgi:hypothetical protein
MSSTFLPHGHDRLVQSACFINRYDYSRWALAARLGFCPSYPLSLLSTYMEEFIMVSPAAAATQRLTPDQHLDYSWHDSIWL